MRIGIQGQPGSACDEAAALLAPGSDMTFEYLTDAGRTFAALASGLVDRAVLALESPVGTPVAETDLAFRHHSSAKIINELRREVRHCIMISRKNTDGIVRKVASHSIPIEKHDTFLRLRFPGYEPIVVDDSGLAAQQLSRGELSTDTAVIAMPRAAEIFELKILEHQLPANDNYLTKFVLVEMAT